MMRRGKVLEHRRRGAAEKGARGELCQLRRKAAVRAGNDWFAAQQAPRGVRKGVEMITLKMISEKFNAWRRYRDAVRELSQFSDHELCDIGIRRCDIEDIVRRTGPR
jgi:uncharacterized protein YjiS (DUF1127 family)